MKRSIGQKPFIYPNPDLLVCTYDRDGKPNGLAVGWAGICNSEPPHLAISVRPKRHSHDALVARGEFTACIPSEEHLSRFDYFGIASGRAKDKFEKTGLTPVRSDLVDAPYVAEFPVVLECRVATQVDLPSHTLFIAEILDVKVEEDVLDDDGNPDITRIRPFVYDHTKYEYHGLGGLLGKAFSDGKRFR
jgi:flavin reductase (DIM6/NTAB) family NADH-FMN oxidoreductase RutF